MDKLTVCVKNVLDENVSSGTVVGIVGCGKFGSEVKNYLAGKGAEVLVCDPPRAEKECEEEYDDIMAAWGNGMGGCTTRRDSAAETVFLPLETVLMRSDVIILALPVAERDVVLDGIKKSPFVSGRKVLDFSGKR